MTTELSSLFTGYSIVVLQLESHAEARAATENQLERVTREKVR